MTGFAAGLSAGAQAGRNILAGVIAGNRARDRQTAFGFEGQRLGLMKERAALENKRLKDDLAFREELFSWFRKTSPEQREEVEDQIINERANRRAQEATVATLIEEAQSGEPGALGRALSGGGLAELTPALPQYRPSVAAMQGGRTGGIGEYFQSALTDPSVSFNSSPIIEDIQSNEFAPRSTGLGTITNRALFPLPPGVEDNIRLILSTGGTDLDVKRYLEREGIKPGSNTTELDQILFNVTGGRRLGR